MGVTLVGLTGVEIESGVDRDNRNDPDCGGGSGGSGICPKVVITWLT
jgi:hypothetical protein